MQRQQVFYAWTGTIYVCLSVGITGCLFHTQKYPDLNDKLCSSPKCVSPVMA